MIKKSTDEIEAEIAQLAAVLSKLRKQLRHRRAYERRKARQS